MALDRYENDTAFAERERICLRYADGMAQTPVNVSETLFADLKSEFSETQIIELTSVIAWENYRARFNHALGVTSDGFSEGAFCPLPLSLLPNR